MRKIKRFLSSLIFLFVLLLLLFYPIFWGSIKHIDTKDDVVFLTFDDGPSENTLNVLDILEKQNVKATFFLIGNNVENYPEIIDTIKAAGHGIGIHSMTHPLMFKNISEELMQSIILTETKAKRKITLFRPPYGFTTLFVHRQAKKLNLTTVLWDVFPRDYKRDSGRITTIINKKMEKGSIMVLHDGPGNREEMIDALPSIINSVHNRGYNFALLDDYI